MKSHEFITEAATSILYHYTSINAAYQILEQGKFELSISLGSIEEKYAPPGYNYFLSTSRSKAGDYMRYVGSSGAVFVLDGNWLSQRYPVKPIDYWERMWLHSDGTRTRESEDRVFSKNSSMSIAPVLSLHVFLREQHEYRSPQIRKLMILAKTKNIPIYLYNDETAWRLQDRRKALTPSQAVDILKGKEPQRRSLSGYTYLDSWLELIYKNKISDLSPRAEKLRYNIKYGYQGEDHNLSTDLSNARKPDAADRYQAVKIIDYMRKMGFRRPVGLVDALREKWKNIQ